MTSRTRKFFGSAFGGGLVGGLVVAVLGAAGLASGVIEADGGSATPAAAPAPVSGSGEGDSSRPVAASGSTTDVGRVYADTAEGVAFIQADGVTSEQASPLGGPSRGTATGSGFLFDEQGHILTNAHVVDGAKSIEVKLGSADSDPIDAELVGSDPSTDVAVLRVEIPDGAAVLPLGESADAEVGDEVIAIGSPFGLDQTVTAGIVSALDRDITSPNGYQISGALQTDAPINPGNSGGPLLDSSGRVIGINSQIESSGGAAAGNVGIGFAVPIDTAERIADELITDGSADHAYLGVSGGDLTPELAQVLNLPEDTDGALVGEVTADGPAAEAGIEGGKGRVSVDGQRISGGGDVITAIDGEPIDGFDAVIAAVDAHDPGDELELTVLRDGDEQAITVTLGERPEGAAS